MFNFYSLVTCVTLVAYTLVAYICYSYLALLSFSGFFCFSVFSVFSSFHFFISIYIFMYLFFSIIKHSPHNVLCDLTLCSVMLEQMLNAVKFLYWKINIGPMVSYATYHIFSASMFKLMLNAL